MSELCRKQKNQRWTWYAAERSCGIILAWHNGRRTDESCRRLMEKLSVFSYKILSY
ncbi:IS1 family transposase [Desulfonema ishimotonii]|uniref:IS1 family transposase n=1 Tax=Desulfonema ishimotonii TaxID=45657 RepID=UPI000F566292